MTTQTIKSFCQTDKVGNGSKILRASNWRTDGTNKIMVRVVLCEGLGTNYAVWYEVQQYTESPTGLEFTQKAYCTDGSYRDTYTSALEVFEKYLKRERLYL